MRMIRRATVGMAIAVAFVVAPVGAAYAASNPSGSGQPGAECGEDNALTAPAGFSSGGFAKRGGALCRQRRDPLTGERERARGVAIRRRLFPAHELRPLIPGQATANERLASPRKNPSIAVSGASSGSLAAPSVTNSGAKCSTVGCA